MTKDLPSPELLRKLLRYEPDTGKLFWRLATPDMFLDGKKHSAKTKCAIWNAKCAGKPALSYREKNRPYAYGDIFGVKVYAHRVICAMRDGTWPEVVDHINGDKQDNRSQNLRSVDHSANAMNRLLGSNNKSGIVGVYWDRARLKWSAEIQANGKKFFLGRFDRKLDAQKARQKAQESMGFSSRHGTVKN